MNRRNTALFVALAIFAALMWLAYERFPNIAYLTGPYEASVGWAAVLKGWPVYTLILSLAALVGLLVGGWVGESSRERDAAETLATQQENLKAQQSKAQQLEQGARIKAAEAAQAQRDAEALLAPSQMRINELSEQNALLKRRLSGSVEALERKKRQVRELRQLDNEALVTEIEQLRSMIRQDRQQIFKLEQQQQRYK
ncbi:MULTISPECIES: hypothetical protein [Halomonas]|uniref:hypothetical protein n=3 Tax=Halomonadaceae TaxID=28256 RepID=UPI0018695FF8|nr:hypothetical protein [Halomonas citrativorans]